MRQILRIDAGSVGYAAASSWQRELHARRVANEIPDVMLLLEHSHVFSIGRRFQPGDLLVNSDQAGRMGVEIHEADRGGSITYHGPGQLVVYPVVDLRPDRGGLPDPIGYLRLLERATIVTVSDFGIKAGLRPGLTGVWVGFDKLAAVGVNVSRGVAKHGVALNVTTDLSFFSAMVPCGIRDSGVTSMQRLGRPVPIRLVAEAFSKHLGDMLGRRLKEASLTDLGLDPPPTPAHSTAEEVNVFA